MATRGDAGASSYRDHAITLKVNGIVIECPPDFDEVTLTKRLQVVQHHV